MSTAAESGAILTAIQEGAVNLNGTSKGITWSLKLNDTSSSWDYAWTEKPTATNLPASIELHVDETKVDEGEVKFNGPDNKSPVFAAKVDENGYITSFIAAENEFNLNNASTILANAAVDGDHIAIIKAGTYNVPTGKNLTITGAAAEGDVIFDMFDKTPNMGGANVTFNNVTFKYSNNNYKGLQHSGNLVYNDCTIDGQVFLYGTSETFNNCTFNQNSAEAYNVWTYGAKEVKFNECTFNSAGKSVLIYSEANDLFNDVTVTDCDFIASAPVDGKAAIEMDSSRTAGIKLTIDSATTASGFGSGNVSNNSLWNNKKGNEEEANNDITVTVNNEVVLKPVVLSLAGEGTEAAPYQINNLEELVWFRDDVNAGNNYSGKYIQLMADIDLNSEEWTPIGNNTYKFQGYFDGNDKTISNLKITGSNKYVGLFGYIKGNGMSSSTTPSVKDLKLTNVDVSGDYYVGGLAGQGYTCNITNVDVSGEVSGTRYVGGLVGHVYTYFKNCSFRGDASCSFDALGGIAGAGDCRAYYCTVIGDIAGYNWVGGIVGNGQEGTSAVGCYVEGKVSTGSNYYFGVGGIAGVAGHGYANSEFKNNYFNGEVYLAGTKVNSVVMGIVNAKDNNSIGTTIEGNSWNTKYYPADTPVVVTSDVSENASPEEWAASASEKSGVRNNNLIMLESDLQYVDAKSMDDVTIMSGSNVSKAAVEEVVYNNTAVAMIGDTRYWSLADAVKDAKPVDTITLFAGEHTLPEFASKELTFKGVDKANTSINDYVNKGSQGMMGSTVHFENLTINGVAENYFGLFHTKEVTYKNCNINGLRFLYAPDVSFEGCAFNANGVEHSFWTYGASNITVTDCTFTYTDRAVNCYSENGENHETDISFSGCSFTYAGSADAPAGAVEINSSSVKSIDVEMDGCDAPEKGAMWYNSQWDSNKGQNTVVTVDDKIVWKAVAKIVGSDDKIVNCYADLHEAMTAAKAGETVMLLDNVDLAGTVWEPVSFKGTFDGQNHIIYNLTINKPGVSNTGFITSLNGTFKNVTFTNPTVTGGENTGVIAGRAGGSKALAENITVNGTIKVETTHSGYARTAVIVGGWAYGNYKNITVDGGDKAVSYVKHTGGGDGRYVAGIVGHADDVDSYVNCTVKNITISGDWLCGAIAGPGPSDGLASGCSVENVDINADYSGGMFGWYYGAGTIEDSTIKDVTFTAGSTNNGAIGGYGNNTDANISNVTIENVQNANGDPLLDHVAQIGTTNYMSLQEALDAANDGETITLLWDEGDAPIAMKGSVFGKTVTITGDATVDWSKDWLYVGRGGEGNGTVIFDNANLTSASNSSSYGIHVSGREKGTDNKYDGTLIIKNSTIKLDYLINRGEIVVDNSSFTVKNGFGIAGRPASETESGENATAKITIQNGSYVKVLNHNGMGIGVASSVKEGNGILNLKDSTFECASFNVDEVLGEFNVYGESTINIGTLTGKEIALQHNAIIKDSTVGGEATLYGNVTFRGDNTFSMIYDYGNAYSTEYAAWTVEEGASLTLTEKIRYGLGYGDNATIKGTLENALTARDSLTEEDASFFTHGLVAMSNWDVKNGLTVKDAYVIIGSNNSFGNSPKSGHTGTYSISFENSVLDSSRITFYEAGSSTEFTFKKSDVKVGTFMTRDKDSQFILTDTKLLSTTTFNGTDEGNYHAGKLELNILLLW